MLRLQCIVVTPDRTLVDQPADFVALPLVDGEIGIGAGRAPFVGHLGAGELRITHQGQVSRYYVEGGFVEVVSDVVTLVAKRAVPAEELDAKVLQEQLDTALARPAHTREEMALRHHAVALIRAQLRVARRSG